MTRRLLLIRRGALGDSICCLPLLAAIKASWPEHHVDFAGVGEVAELFEARGACDRGWSVERFAACAPDRLGPLEDYDLWLGQVPDELNDERAHPIATKVDPESSLPAAQQMLEAARNAWPTRWVEVDDIPRLERPSADAGVDPSASSETNDASGVECEPLDPSPMGHDARPLLWLHPGSGSPSKNWDGFVELAHIASVRAWRIAASFGEADDLTLDRLVPALPPGTEILRGASLVEFARRLEQAQVFVGNDSGPTHLAAALGLTTLCILLRGTSPAWWPRGDRVEICGKAGGPPCASSVMQSIEAHAEHGGATEVR